jgi:hypothetical protein
MRVLIMGGTRHGEWLELMDGSASYLDLMTAETYPIRAITWVTQENGGAAYRVSIAVHPSLTNLPPQAEQQQVQDALFRMTMSYWMANFGELTTPAAAVPPSPAALFGPDGTPLPTTIHEPPVEGES